MFSHIKNSFDILNKPYKGNRLIKTDIMVMSGAQRITTPLCSELHCLNYKQELHCLACKQEFVVCYSDKLGIGYQEKTNKHTNQNCNHSSI